MEPVVDVLLGEAGIGVGRAHFSLRRGEISTVFSYDESYLARGDAFAIDPKLPLTKGSSFVAGLPGAFSDAAPNRWGRRLIRRAFSRMLDDVDYLLGVFDGTRQGALRFKLPGETSYCIQGAEIPPIVQLPRLLVACRAVLTDDDAVAEVKQLLDVGSSTLGGARPKATVVDGGALYIAKFSAPSDEHDVIAWEKTAIDVAQAAGIRVPRARLVRIGEESVLLTERFDRKGEVRFPYLSAMTLLGAHDGDQRDYAEIADALGSFVGNPEQDLRELYRRIIVSVFLNNTDDHLRNHGFVRSGNRWQLSPVFDINPHPDAHAFRATAIYGALGGREQCEALYEMAPLCALTHEDARCEVRSVLSATIHWGAVARRNGCREREIRLFQEVFEQRRSELASVFKV